MTTNAQCGTPQASPTNYSKHIRLLMTEADRVPVGWRKTYADAMRDLLTKDCASRSNLRVSGPFIEAGEIAFEVSKDDACVAGILRKTAARLRGQCQVCGAPARMRVNGIKRRPLCSECYAPRALASDLTRLLRDLAEPAAADSRTLYSAHDLSPRIRALLPASCWHHVQSECGIDVTRCLTTHDLRGMSDWLRAVRERVLAMTTAATTEVCAEPIP
jgi:hypothetical protein